MDVRAGESRRSYRIAVRGHLDESWSGWLSGIAVSVERAEDGTPLTVLTGEVADQAALRGILNRLWDMNLSLISVNPISRDPAREEANR